MLNCPNCNSESVATILFGMPSFSEKLMKDRDEEKWYLVVVRLMKDFSQITNVMNVTINGKKREQKMGILLKKMINRITLLITYNG